jgi:hypothetical protein
MVNQLFPGLDLSEAITSLLHRGKSLVVSLGLRSSLGFAQLRLEPKVVPLDARNIVEYLVTRDVI